VNHYPPPEAECSYSTEIDPVTSQETIIPRNRDCKDKGGIYKKAVCVCPFVAESGGSLGYRKTDTLPPRTGDLHWGNNADSSSRRLDASGAYQAAAWEPEAAVPSIRSAGASGPFARRPSRKLLFGGLSKGMGGGGGGGSTWDPRAPRPPPPPPPGPKCYCMNKETPLRVG